MVNKLFCLLYSRLTEPHSAKCKVEEISVNLDDRNETPETLKDNQSTSKKLSALYSTPKTFPSAKKPRFSFPAPAEGNKTSDSSSCYFLPTKSANKSMVNGKPKVSGLLKKKNSSQQNLMQMWAKSN